MQTNNTKTVKSDYSRKLGFTLIIMIIILAIVGILTQKPIVQDADYHLFKDSRTIWAIPNFWNVISNLPFLIVGVLGLFKLIVAGKLKIVTDIKIAYFLFFFSLILVSFASGYYHLRPNNQTLIWDRLLMTIIFMSIFSIIITEFISIYLGKVMLWTLILCGISSVIYWHYSELLGKGDLRFYAIVQFLPMLVIPVILIFFQSTYSNISSYWCLLVAYIIAKLFEYFDSQVYDMLGFIGGHAIKHILTALGIYVLLYSYEWRYSSRLKNAADAVSA